MTGRMPEEGINPVEPPDLLWDLWQHFLALHATRSWGLGPGPITELEIRAYCLNRGLRFEGWELRTIRALDAVALAEPKPEGKPP